mgnify:CR=1 FL=1
MKFVVRRMIRDFLVLFVTGVVVLLSLPFIMKYVDMALSWYVTYFLTVMK